MGGRVMRVEQPRMLSAGMGEVVMGFNEDVLHVSSLGSCVAVCLYSNKKNIALLGHVVLPEYKSRGQEPSLSKPVKYADIAIPYMVRILTSRYNVPLSDCRAKIVGGAQMFAVLRDVEDRLQIGMRNVAVIKKMLVDLGIELVAEETGGTTGRTVRFHATTKQLTIRTKGDQLTTY